MMGFYFEQDDAGMAEAVVTVSDLNYRLARMFEDEPGLSGIAVIGEVSDLKMYPSGHWYYSLKDAKSQLKAVMFRSSAQRQVASGFIPENGMMVVAKGDIRVYEPNGVYQIIVESMAPAGEGAKYAAFLKLKEKLLKEGLFDQARKKPVPGFVRHVALVTSPSSAAARDFIKVSRARWQGMRITVFPAVMQGPSAPSGIIDALFQADSFEDAQVVVIARGGGSSEDLWCFNDEGLARTIAAMSKPVVTGIGHEVDFTIADFAADLRASTPSNAAELVTPDGYGLRQGIEAAGRRMTARVAGIISSARAALAAISSKGPLSRPMDMLDVRRQMLDEMGEDMKAAMDGLIKDARSRLMSLEASLSALNPDAVLARGYAVCTLGDGTVVRSAVQAPEGTGVQVRLKSGKLGCKVESSCD